jgi:hypothetical protein
LINVNEKGMGSGKLIALSDTHAHRDHPENNEVGATPLLSRAVILHL